MPTPLIKSYQYQAIVVEDRGHLTSRGFLDPLNLFGLAEGECHCPNCGLLGHAFAHGWKRSEEQAMGATKLAVLLEREVWDSCDAPRKNPNNLSNCADLGTGDVGTSPVL